MKKLRRVAAHKHKQEITINRTHVEQRRTKQNDTYVIKKTPYEMRL
jgi:hypothetical protein